MASVIGTVPHYLSYVNSLFGQLDCSPTLNDVVWHYTTGTSLISIIESGTIFATQVSCLNDATEIRYSAAILREVLSEMLETLSEDERVLTFLRTFISLLEDDDNLPNHNALPYFVCCFSALQDDLSQWRCYGGGENGYAIGIRTSELMEAPFSAVAKVNYNPETHLKLAKDVAQATIRFYKEGLDTNHPNWDETFLKVWDDVLSFVAPVIKNPGFASEKEVRVIRQLQGSDIPNIRILQRKTMMSRHLPMTFPSGAKSLPIAKVMVGPSRHKAITKNSVDLLLKSKGYPSDLVCTSCRPYQEM
jgi:Protein of unknown function (DUF2971)